MFGFKRRKAERERKEREAREEAERRQQALRDVKRTQANNLHAEKHRYSRDRGRTFDDSVEEARARRKREQEDADRRRDDSISNPLSLNSPLNPIYHSPPESRCDPSSSYSSSYDSSSSSCDSNSSSSDGGGGGSD